MFHWYFRVNLLVLQALILPAVGISIWGFVMSRPAVFFAAVFGGIFEVCETNCTLNQGNTPFPQEKQFPKQPHGVPLRQVVWPQPRNPSTSSPARPRGLLYFQLEFNQRRFYAIFWSYWSWIYIEFSKLSSSLSPVFLFVWCFVDGIWKMVLFGSTTSISLATWGRPRGYWSNPIWTGNKQLWEVFRRSSEEFKIRSQEGCTFWMRTHCVVLEDTYVNDVTS